LECNGNQLTALDVSGCAALGRLECANNQLSADALNSLFGTLPLTSRDYDAKIYIGNNPGTSACNRSIAVNKGWSVE
jgi:hypothetical protein